MCAPAPRWLLHISTSFYKKSGYTYLYYNIFILYFIAILIYNILSAKVRINLIWILAHDASKSNSRCHTLEAPIIESDSLNRYLSYRVCEIIQFLFKITILWFIGPSVIINNRFFIALHVITRIRVRRE